MLKQIFVVGFVALFFVGCAGKNDDPTKDIKVDYKAPEIPAPKLPAADKGGQPGAVVLGGKAASDSVSSLKIEIVGGKGPKNEVVEVDKSNLALSQDISQESGKSLAHLRANNFYAVGCEENQDLVQEMSSGKETIAKELEPIFDMGYITADTVIICRKMTNRTMGLSITANTVVLDNIKIDGSAIKEKISIVAKNLILRGKNSLNSYGKFLGYVTMAGPEIRVEITDQISGDGTLTIHSEGANVKSQE